MGRVSAAAPPAWSPEATRDRLSSTVFLAALFHGILILGVTFNAGPTKPGAAPTSLDVVLVTGTHEPMAAPDDARLLATRNLAGQGNAAETQRLRTALPAETLAAPPGPDRLGDGQNPRESGTPLAAREQLTTVAYDRSRVLPERGGEQAAPATQTPFVNGQELATDILAEPDTDTVIPDVNPRELTVSASTREARIASYLSNWKARVERIGTLNFPRAAQLQGADAHPVVEVAIAASGRLREVVVRNSSGYRTLDQAAVDIVQIAAPFEPFPAVLREDYDVLRFAYEWHFTGGVARGRITSVGGS
jgi:protein TonB